MQRGDHTAMPYKDYLVVEPPADRGDEYVTFPQEPDNLYQYFRHSWVLVRKKRPDVVCIEGAPMPKANKSPEENCKYFNVFFRPWTLTHGTPEVPHIGLIGLLQSKVREAYARFENTHN